MPTPRRDGREDGSGRAGPGALGERRGRGAAAADTGEERATEARGGAGRRGAARPGGTGAQGRPAVTPAGWAASGGCCAEYRHGLTCVYRVTLLSHGDWALGTRADPGTTAPTQVRAGKRYTEAS